MALSPDVVVVAPGELITAAHINNIRANLVGLDAGKLALTGGVLTGNLFVQEPGGNGYYILDAASALLLSLFHTAGPPNSVLLSGGSNVALRHLTGGSDRMTILADGNMLWGTKLAANNQVAGMEFQPHGRLDITQTIGSVNVVLVKAGASPGNGQAFTYYNNAAASIGSVTMTSGLNGVLFNTTSDRRLKSLTRIVDPDEALDKVARMEPVNFVWRDASAAGEQTGFFAQDLHTVAPEAVTVGRGEPGDEADPDDPANPGFVPWMADHSALVPTLVAAVQALTRKVADLQARIEQLQGATS